MSHRIAGTDTSAVTMTFTLLLLLNNIETLAKLTAELETAFPFKHDSITFANTQDLPYLNAVINESMRVRPIVAVGKYTSQRSERRLMSRTCTIYHRTMHDLELCHPERSKQCFHSTWKLELTIQTTVIAGLSEMMRDPRIWPDSTEFIPERWLGTYKGADVDRKAFLPFSAGSRNCIGQQ